MRKCLICGIDINQSHGNSKYCKKHTTVKRDRKVLPIEQKVTMSYEDFKELKRLADIGKIFEEVL